MQQMMCCKLRSIVLVLTLVATWSGMAFATDVSAPMGAARELAKEARGDFDAGRFEEAGRKFQRAYEIANVPVFVLWAARSLARHGELVSASEFYRQAISLAPNDFWIGNAQQEAQAEAAKELGELQPRIPRLLIRVESAGANEVEITIDDVKIASALVGIEIPKDPGRRHIVGKKGAETVEQTIELGEGEHKEAVLTFISESKIVVVAPPPPPPPPPPPSRTQRIWGWVAVTIGGAGLFTGAVTGIIVASNSGLRSDCPNGTCDPSKVSSGSASTYNLMRNLSTAGFVVGGIGTAVGVTLLLWTPKDELAPRAALWLGPNSAGIKGEF